ncbi:transposase IS1400, partial [Sphingobacterium sp. IITKGP-BTPF85]
MCRSQYYYVSKKDDSAVMAALNDLSSKHPVYGFRKLYAYLRREGKPWNHKKVYRVYKLLNMNKKRRVKRRLPVREKQPLEQQVSINQKWSMDFMSDSLASGNRFRTFNVMDDCSREILCIEVATSISSVRVTRALEQIIDWRGKPLCLRVDNGPEFTSHHFDLWCKSQGIAIQLFSPENQRQNGYIERLIEVIEKKFGCLFIFQPDRSP